MDVGVVPEVVPELVLKVELLGNHQTNNNNIVAAEASLTAVILAASIALVARAKRFSSELPAKAIIAKQTQAYPA